MLGLAGLLVPVDGGTLTSVTASADSLVAGAQGVKMTFGMTLATALPASGSIDVQLPSTYSITRGYWSSSAVAALTGNLDGSFSVYGSSATLLKISRYGGSQVRATHDTRT